MQVTYFRRIECFSNLQKYRPKPVARKNFALILYLLYANYYGLRVIKHTLHELDGLWDVSVQNGRFIATFMIPMTKQRH